MKNRKYQGEAWKSFRKDIIESDGFICSQCGRNSFDVILQVHHKKYIAAILPGPWRFPRAAAGRR